MLIQLRVFKLELNSTEANECKFNSTQFNQIQLECKTSMLTTRFAMKQIQHFSTVLNCFEFNSTAVTNLQFNLFDFEAFSMNSTYRLHCG